MSTQNSRSRLTLNSFTTRLLKLGHYQRVLELYNHNSRSYTEFWARFGFLHTASAKMLPCAFPGQREPAMDMAASRDI